MIGGKERTRSFESIITGYSSKSFIRCEYSVPFGCSDSISDIVIESEQAKGVKEKSPGTVITLKGGSRDERS